MMKKILFTMVAVLFGSVTMFAQFPTVQNWRAYDKTGLGVFEAPKESGGNFTGQKLRIGGAFTQSYQALTHENNPDTAGSSGKLKLKSMTSGFNTAQANLFFDTQLEDGVLLNLTLYLSARHHNETWVKGGFIQINKLEFLGSDVINSLMKNLTIRVGHMEVNFGDSHFRRSDGGMTMYNAFAENMIIDDFATEIGGDVMFRSGGILAMVGATSGAIKGTLDQLNSTAADKDSSKSMAIVAKLGYDTKMGDNGRLRVTGSIYTVKSSQSNTLFWGDRTGSNYYFVMENTAATTSANAWSGRVNPGLSDKVTAIQANAFFKMSGLEIFGTFETATGRSSADTADRSFNQICADATYRLGSKEDFFVAARYNMVKGKLLTNNPLEVSVDRIAIGAGWFLTNNIMLKGEWVMQSYKDYPTKHILREGKFSGAAIQACVGF